MTTKGSKLMVLLCCAQESPNSISHTPLSWIAEVAHVFQWEAVASVLRLPVCPSACDVKTLSSHVCTRDTVKLHI